MSLIPDDYLPPPMAAGLAGAGPGPAAPPFAFPGGPIIPLALLGGIVPPPLVGYYALTPPAYRPPSPTGWRPVARRRGPDPDAAMAVRAAGRG